MADKTQITIKDKGRTKIYNLPENFLFQIKILIAFIIFFIILLMFSTINVAYKNHQLYRTNRILYEKSRKLLQENNSLLIESVQVNKKLSIYNEKIQDLEIAVAIDSIDNELKEQIKNNVYIKPGIKQAILTDIPNGYPLEELKINDYFGLRIHPISGNERMHYGVDLKATVKTPVYATASGFVEYAANSDTGYGYLVILSHNYGFKTRYAHLYSKEVVRVGQWVNKGELIGYSGNTGFTTGPHLHYEVRFLERAVEPVSFLMWNFDNFTDIFVQERKIPWQALSMAISER